MAQSTEQEPSDDELRRRYHEGISLAGPRERPANDRHNTYVEPGYRDENPWVDEHEQNAGSEFSLAGTFPHKRRFQGRHKKDDETPLMKEEEKGETEVDPQVAAAGDQREENENGPSESDQQTQVGASEDSDSKTKRPLPGPRQVTSSMPLKQLINATRSDNKKGKGVSAEDQASYAANQRPYNLWAAFRLKFHRPLAEWLGMTIFMFLGCCGTMAIVTSQEAAGAFQTIYWVWGFAVMLGIYVSGGGSGGFLNPGFTIMLSTFRGFPARRIPSYVLAQVLGAFTGALLAFAIYRDNILHMDGAFVPESTGVYFYTQPKSWISPAAAFFTEFLSAAVLGCCILALGDSSNSPPGAGMHAFIIGLLITTVLMATGYNTGAALNGARDLGPRLALMCVGYPTSIFTAFHNWWIWGPWVANITGSLAGGLVYDACIFRGNESPVNFSKRRYKLQSRKAHTAWLKSVSAPRRKTVQMEREMEEGLAKDKQGQQD